MSVMTVPQKPKNNTRRQGQAIGSGAVRARNVSICQTSERPYGWNRLRRSLSNKNEKSEAPEDAPDQVVLQISGSLQMMDSNLRLYGHPELLRVAEAINGADFVPFTDAVWVKPEYMALPCLGTKTG